MIFVLDTDKTEEQKEWLEVLNKLAGEFPTLSITYGPSSQLVNAIKQFGGTGNVVPSVIGFVVPGVCTTTTTSFSCCSPLTVRACRCRAPTARCPLASPGPRIPRCRRPLSARGSRRWSMVTPRSTGRASRSPRTTRLQSRLSSPRPLMSSCSTRARTCSSSSTLRVRESHPHSSNLTPPLTHSFTLSLTLSLSLSLSLSSASICRVRPLQVAGSDL